jgi:triosephosphate isomerase
MSKLIIANWKSNKTPTEASDWVEQFLQLGRRENRTYVLCPSFPLLPFVADVQEHGIELGVQDLSPFGAGAYTGEVAAYSLQQLGVSFAILGHSERRKYFSESSQLVAQKVEQALDFGLTPIVCVDRAQIQEQADLLSKEQKSKILVAYEPVHAISTFGGHEDPIETTLSIIAEIQEVFGEKVPVLYGGSVNPDNSLVYLEQESIAGVLVGGTSLDAAEFARL